MLDRRRAGLPREAARRLATSVAGKTPRSVSTVPPPDPNVSLLRLENSIASLRTGLMIVGVIAIAALGVAVYALLSGGTLGDAKIDARVSSLERRVDALGQQLPSASGGGGDTAALSARVDALERTVKTLADRPATDPRQAIEQLSGRIDALSRDVEQLKQTQTQTTP
jgi:hypothetical protein